MSVVSKQSRLSMIAMCVLALAACKAGAPAAQEPASKPEQPAVAQPAATPETAASPLPSLTEGVLSTLSEGMAYGDVRRALLADGWLPLRDPKCWENVGGEANVCNFLPETESCSADGYCLAHFAKAPDADLSVTAYGNYKSWDKSGGDSSFNLRSFELARVEKPVAPCPSQNFDEFLRQFAADERVELAYTAPLVKVAELEDRGDQGYFPREVYIKAAAYRGFNVAYADNAYRFLDSENNRDANALALKIDAPTPDRRDVSYAYGLSEGNSYRFDKKDACWVLTEDPEPPSP